MDVALVFTTFLISTFAVEGEPKRQAPQARSPDRIQDSGIVRGGNPDKWMTYRDPKLHFQFAFPVAWGLASGHHTSGHYHDSFASLNNFGRSDFWMFEYVVAKGDREGEALPPGGVCIDVGQTTGPGGLTLDDQFKPSDDLEASSLRDVLAKPLPESKQNGVRQRVIQFMKWRRWWTILICTRDPIDPKDEERIQRFLTDFRFADFPTGDSIWTMAQARQRLSRYTQSGPFPLLGSRGYDSVERARRGDDVIVRFSQANRYWESQSAWEFRVTPRGETFPLFESKPKTFQTSEWGSQQSGLQCRITAPTAIEPGLPLTVTLRFRGLRDSLEPEKKVLNTFLLSQFLTLHLKNRTNDSVVVVRPFGFSTSSWPIDDGQGSFPLDNENFGKDSRQVTFPLVSVREALPPGAYECSLQFSFPNEPTLWWDSKKDWRGFNFWHGTIHSAAVPLAVLPARTNVWTFLCPQQLHHGSDGGIYFLEADAARKELPVRNGFFVGTFLLDHRNNQKFVWRGTPAPYNIPVLANTARDLGEVLLSYTLEIFETASPPIRPFNPGLGESALDPYEYGGDLGWQENADWYPQEPSADYRVLWKKEFTVGPAESTSLRQSPWKP